jgi:hypothetical protein
MMAEGWEQHSIAPAPLPIVAFSRIPRDEYARRARAIGADVHNA